MPRQEVRTAMPWQEVQEVRAAMPWQEVRDIQNALEYEWKVGARFYKVPPARHSSHDIVPTVFFFFS